MQQAAAAKQREQQQCKASASQARSRAASAGPLVGSNSQRPPELPLQRPVVPDWASRHHSSHHMCFVQGTFFCNVCGAFASTSRAGLLYSPCRAAGLTQEALTQWQRARPQLRRLQFGKRPVSLTVWPDGSTVSPAPVHRLIRGTGGWTTALHLLAT